MKKPFVFVTRVIPEEALISLKEIAEVEVWPSEAEPVPRDVLLEKTKKASGILTMLTDRIDGEMLESALNLKVISNLAVGYDNIDVESATEKGIVVCNTPDVLTDTTADLTFGLLMATSRRLVEASEYIKKGKWQHWSPLLLAGTDIHHKTLGIVGMGRIGSAVAKRAIGFEMEVLYYNRSRNDETEETTGAYYVNFNELLKRSDFVVCLAPMTDETKHLFNEEAFRMMKSASIFINASRGGLVDEKALEQALENKEIAAAGLDVFEQEPIDNKHPLLKFNNVVALPHIGSASVETRMEMANMACRHIIRALRNEKPEAVVNSTLFS